LLAFQIGLGVLFYSLIVEKWSFQNALYFTIGTITTVGYGNLAPSSDFSKMFTVVYALSGIITLGVVLGMFGLWIVKQTQIGHAELQQRREMERLDTFTECADPKWNNDFSRGRRKDRLKTRSSQLRQAMADAKQSSGCEICWAFAPLLWMILLGAVVFSWSTKMTIVDAIYVAAMTCLAIGYNDTAISLATNRGFFSVYMLVRVAFYIPSLPSLPFPSSHITPSLSLLHTSFAYSSHAPGGSNVLHLCPRPHCVYDYGTTHPQGVCSVGLLTHPPGFRR
jgi:hypothetical protein